MASAKGARTAAIWGAGLLQDNQAKVLGELGQGYDAAQGYLGQAGDLYKGMTTQGQQGLDKYNALTLGSGADIQQALAGNAGYQFNMDQGLQALQRSRAAGGMLNSGNTDTDTLAFAQGLAGQQLSAERAALNPYLGMYQQGIGGQAGVLGTQAGAASDYYTSRANTLDSTTKDIVGLGTQALTAGDQAKSQNQANGLAAAKAVGSIALGLMTGGAGFGLMGAMGAAGAMGGMGGGFTKT